jgi:hypothetical protein
MVKLKRMREGTCVKKVLASKQQVTDFGETSGVGVIKPDHR